MPAALEGKTVIVTGGSKGYWFYRSENSEPGSMVEAYDAWLEKDKYFDDALDAAVVGLLLPHKIKR